MIALPAACLVGYTQKRHMCMTVYKSHQTFQTFHARHYQLKLYQTWALSFRIQHSACAQCPLTGIAYNVYVGWVSMPSPNFQLITCTSIMPLSGKQGNLVYNLVIIYVSYCSCLNTQHVMLPAGWVYFNGDCKMLLQKLDKMITETTGIGITVGRMKACIQRHFAILKRKGTRTLFQWHY